MDNQSSKEPEDATAVYRQASTKEQNEERRAKLDQAAEDWRAQAAQREKEDRAFNEQARRRPVYLAKGPIVGAVLIANLITIAVGALIYSIVSSVH